MIKAASVALEIDLRDFSLFLRAQGVDHRINEESGQQAIWVDNQAAAEFVKRALMQWDFAASDGHVNSSRASGSRTSLLYTSLRLFLESPVSMGLIAVCVIVALISQLGIHSERVAVLFYPQIATDGLWSLLGDLNSVGLIVRSLTPMFLHFGELHLIFNMLWLWYFGRQLEPSHPAWLFVLVIVLTSFASNTTQYLYTGYNNFGGMSGVVYGLVGYTWVVHSLMPRTRLMLNNNMFVVFLVALVLMEIVASSWIATAAHVGGLIMGVVLGLGIVIFYRFVLRKQAVSKE